MTKKGLKKLIKTPHIFIKDYAKKRLDSTQLEYYGTKVLDINVPVSSYYYLLYTLLKQEKKYARSKQALEKAISIQPKAKYYYELGLMLKSKKQWWQATEAFEKAISKANTPDPSWYKEYAHCLTQMNRHSDAAAAWEKFLLTNSEDANSWFLYGYALALSGQVQNAKKAYQKAIEYDKNKNAKTYGIGIFFEKRGEWIQAKEAYANTLMENPLNANLLYRYALSLDRCYEWEEAEKQYLKAITLAPEKIDWYYRLGFVRERQKKYESAAEAYRYAANHREKHTPYWYYRLGYVLNKNKEYKKSTEAFLMMKSITLSEQTDDSFFTPNKLEYIQDNIDQLKAILDQDTTRDDLWYQLAKAYEAIDEYEEATYAYKKTIERKNNFDSSLYFSLGKIMAFQRKYEEANKIFIEQEILHHSNLINSKRYLDSKKFKLKVDYTEYYERLDIEEKTVMFESFKGEHFSDNPYAIFKYMLNHPEFKYWKFVWVLSDKNNIPDKYLKLKNLIIIKRETDQYLRYLSKSRILINNTQFPYYFIKKDKQIYVNTWHGTPWKTLGIDNPYQNGNTARNFIQADFLISPNKHTSNILLNRYSINGLFRGELLEIGYPRIDNLINISHKEKKKLKEKLGISDDKPIVLYAPTYKGLWSDPNIESDETISNIEKMKNEKFHLLFRGHYFIEEKLSKIGLNSTIIAKHSIDTCELLSIVDVLVTDYSSIMFDYLPKNKPIIVFAPDYEQYKSDRGLYLNKNEVPGHFVDNINELNNILVKAIDHPEYYLVDHEKFIEEYASYEDGKVSLRLINKLVEKISQNTTITEHNKGILVYPGTIKELKDLDILKNYLNDLTNNNIGVYCIFNKSELVSQKDILTEIDNVDNLNAKVEYSGTPIHLLEEYWLINKINSHNIKLNRNNKTIFEKYYQREFRRLFGNQSFSDIVILNENNELLGNILQNVKRKKIV